mmetsp:Transcript_38071/g.89121  ORF Transcript_38071/g.89121 Transcript_38071/m.89121 type:complete len:784 (+) Transcript_38071:83-2434(+)
MEVLRVRVSPWENNPIEVTSFAPTQIEPRLLVCRMRGSLELWDSISWQQRYAVPGTDQRYLVRGAAWFPKDDITEEEAAERGVSAMYIFTAGFSGEIAQWDAANLAPIAAVSCGGGRVWSLCSVPAQRLLLVGCEDGTLRMWSHSDGGTGVHYTGRHIQVSQSKVISTALYEDDSIFAGHVDSQITRWSLKSRTCEGRIELDRGGQKEALCWCLYVLRGRNILVSGDNLGMVQLWDCNTLVLVQRFMQHQADVLSLSATPDGSFLVAGSADSKVTAYHCQSNTAEGRWEFVSADFSNTNDVRSLSVDPLSSDATKSSADRGPLWVAGGVSGKLLIYGKSSKGGDVGHLAASRSPLESSLFSPFFNSCRLASKPRLAACQGSLKMELWYLGSDRQAAQDALDDEDEPLPADLEAGCVRLPSRSTPKATLLMNFQLGGGKTGSQSKHIMASDICEDGSMAALSDLNGTRIFYIDIAELTVTPEQQLPLRMSPSRALRFCGHADRILAASMFSDHKVVLVEPSSGILCSMESHRHPVHILEGSHEWLVSADTSGAVHLTNLDSLSHFARLPTSSAEGVFPTAVGLNHAQKQVIVALSNHEVLIYKIEEDGVSFVSTLRGLQVPRSLLRSHQRICGVTPVPEKPELVLLWGESFLLGLNLDYASKMEPDGLTERTGVSSEKEVRRRLAPDRITTTGPWRMYPKLKHCLSVCSVLQEEWGDPLLQNHAVTAVDRRALDDGSGQPPAKKARMAIQTTMISFEVTSDKAKDGPQPFERKRYQASNMRLAR